MSILPTEGLIDPTDKTMGRIMLVLGVIGALVGAHRLFFESAGPLALVAIPLGLLGAFFAWRVLKSQKFLWRLPAWGCVAGAYVCILASM